MDTSSRPKSKMIATYVDRLPPCNNVCPAGENIQKWLNLAKHEKFREAWEVIVQSNPFPAIHGRVCYHYCETKCNRIQYDQTVGVHCVERFLGDMAIAEGWGVSPPSIISGKKVLVVGAGPAGLSAAYHLRLMGHEVTIYEALSQAGGMALVGIPAYRLPREVLSSEIKRIFDIGVKIDYNHKVKDIIAEKKRGGFDAVFLSIGAHLGKSINFLTENPCTIVDAVDYLRGIALGKPLQLVGSRLVVYGGGNTAIDVARSAKRLGVSDITVVYHRTREKMSAFPKEIKEAKEEGIKFIFLRTIMGLNKNTLNLSINELDAEGRPKQSGEFEQLETDALILALSQTPGSDFLRKIPEITFQSNGEINVDDSFMTGYSGIFAGGDMVLGYNSITVAVSHAKSAARYINAYLNGVVYNKPVKHEIALFDKLHIGEIKSSKVEEKLLDASARVESFVEITKQCSQNEIFCEAKRCFSCGNCFECDACYNICPVKAISKLGPGKRYKIDAEKCIGCGKCFKNCPCGAIIMTERL